MGDASVVWAETPNEDDETSEAEAHGEVDESFAARRLRRWLKGMFGGKPAGEREEPGAEGARPRSGPVEGAPGEPEGSPGENH